MARKNGMKRNRRIVDQGRAACLMLVGAFNVHTRVLVNVHTRVLGFHVSGGSRGSLSPSFSLSLSLSLSRSLSRSLSFSLSRSRSLSRSLARARARALSIPLRLDMGPGGRRDATQECRKRGRRGEGREEEGTATGQKEAPHRKNEVRNAHPFIRAERTRPCRLPSDDEWALMGKRQQRPKPSVQDTMGVRAISPLYY